MPIRATEPWTTESREVSRGTCRTRETFGNVLTHCCDEALLLVSTISVTSPFAKLMSGVCLADVNVGCGRGNREEDVNSKHA